MDVSFSFAAFNYVAVIYKTISDIMPKDSKSKR